MRGDASGEHAASGRGAVRRKAGAVRAAVYDGKVRAGARALAEGVLIAVYVAQHHQHIRAGRHENGLARAECVRAAALCRKARVKIVQFPYALLERLAVERVAHAAHALLVPVIYAGHAGNGELQQGAQLLRFNRGGKLRVGKAEPDLLLPAERTDVHAGAQRRAYPVHIV